MPILKIKLISDDKVADVKTALAAYVAGAGGDLATFVRGTAMDMFVDPGDKDRVAVMALAHGGLDLPVTKTADVQFVFTDKDKVAAAQASLDEALSNVVHATDVSGDTTVAGEVTVGDEFFFDAAEDVGRKMNVGGVVKTVTGASSSAGSPAVAATGTITTIAADDLVDGETFVLDDGVNPAVTFEFDTNASVTPTPTLRAVDIIQSAAATGTITTVAGANLVDGETFVLNDGINPAVTFEFDDNASVVETPTLRQVTFGVADTADNVRDTIITAVTNAPALDISASSGGPATVSLVNDTPGAAGNVAVTETVADVGFVVTGMSGGVDGDSADDVRDTVVTAVTGAPALDISASSGGPATVSLVNDTPGAAGNVAVTETVADAGFVVAGMAGGADAVAASSTATYGGVALASGTGVTVKLLGAESLQSLTVAASRDDDGDTRAYVVAAVEGQRP